MKKFFIYKNKKIITGTFDSKPVVETYLKDMSKPKAKIGCFENNRGRLSNIDPPIFTDIQLLFYKNSPVHPLNQFSFPSR